MPPETQNDLAAAEAVYRRAEAEGDPNATFYLGVLLHQKGDLEGAEEAYRRSDENKHPTGAFNLGVLLQTRGDLRGAEAAYRRAVERGEMAGACNLGALLLRRGDVDGAEAACRRAAEHGDAIGALYLATLLHRRGDRVGAQAAYRLAAERGDPDVVERANAGLIELHGQAQTQSDDPAPHARGRSVTLAVRRGWGRVVAIGGVLVAATASRMRGVGRFLGTHAGRFALLLLLLLIGGVIALVAVLGSGSSSSSPAPTAQSFGTALGAVPTNRVTGSGSATVSLRGDTATVTLRTTGLLNGSPHLAHIHGLGLGTCPTGSAARLHNGHRLISTGDGIRWYGSALTSLTEWGSTAGSVPNNIDMNRYSASGNIHYTRTITVSRLVADLIRDGDATIVVHGIDYNDNHIYDFRAFGVSDLDKSLPGEATAPALCGPLRPAAGNQTASAGNASATTGSASATATFVASLTPEPASVSDGGSGDLSLFCHIGQSAAIDSAANTTSGPI